MTYDQAVKLLTDGGRFVELAEAIGVVTNEASGAIEHILLGLKYPGFVAEQAALALYSRTGLGRTENGIDKDQDRWAERLGVRATVNR